MTNIITNDYVGLAIQNNIKLEKIYLESMLEVYEAEKAFIEDCLEAGMITLEAMDKTEVEVVKKRNIIERIFDALNALFGKFKEKITILTDKNAIWLKRNLVNLNMENVKKLPEFEAYPLWLRTDKDIMNDLQTLANNVINQTKNKHPDLQGIEAVVRKTIGGKGDSIGKDAIAYFRSGKRDVPLQTVKINGEGLSKYFQEMYNYAIKYDKIVVPSVQKYMNQLKNTVKTIAPPEQVNESFCYLENALYSDTMIGLLPNPNASFVLEETEDSQVKNGKIDDNPNKEKTQSVTSIKMSSSDDDKKDTKSKVQDTQYVKDVTNVLKILQGAALTVLEERYLLFIAIFKAVLNNAGAKVDDKGDSKDEENNQSSNDNSSDKKEKKKKKFFKREK